MIVQEERLLAVTPVGPVRQPGELLAGGPHERLPVHAVEGVAEVDLQKRQIRLSMLAKHIPQGMRHHATGATNAVVLPLEESCDLLLRPQTEALPDQPSQRVATAQWPNPVAPLTQGDRTPPERKGRRKAGASPLASWFTAAARARDKSQVPAL